MGAGHERGHGHDHGHDRGHDHAHDHGHAGDAPPTSGPTSRVTPDLDPGASSWHGHGHGHDHGLLSSHGRDRDPRARRALAWTLLFNATFLGVEGSVGLATGSLALLSDAVHMLGDVTSLSLALVAARLADLPRTPRRSFGLVRAETLGAFINGLLLLLAAAVIAAEAAERLSGPPPEVPGLPVLVVGALGLLINLGSVAVLLRARGGRGDLNLRGALVHMAADALGSVGAIVAAVALLMGFPIADPLISVVIAGLVAWGAWPVLRESGKVLLQLVPDDVDLDALRAAMAAVPGVRGVHELHLWSLDGRFHVLTAHLVADPGEDRHALRDAVREVLRARFQVEHATLQVETEAEALHDGVPHD
jgi:cobalt-zinc-cadmium efflux system protein